MKCSAIWQDEAPSFDYGGQKYRFQHLGAFLGSGPSLAARR